MKYVFAAGCTIRQGKAGQINDMYHRLCEKFSSVAVYHRSCRKSPLFSGDVTVISNCPSCWKHYEGLPSVTMLSLDEALA